VGGVLELPTEPGVTLHLHEREKRAFRPWRTPDKLDEQRGFSSHRADNHSGKPDVPFDGAYYLTYLDPTNSLSRAIY
jgi:hypothetical protein